MSKYDAIRKGDYVKLALCEGWYRVTDTYSETDKLLAIDAEQDGLEHFAIPIEDIEDIKLVVGTV